MKRKRWLVCRRRSPLAAPRRRRCRWFSRPTTATVAAHVVVGSGACLTVTASVDFGALQFQVPNATASHDRYAANIVVTNCRERVGDDPRARNRCDRSRSGLVADDCGSVQRGRHDQPLQPRPAAHGRRRHVPVDDEHRRSPRDDPRTTPDPHAAHPDAMHRLRRKRSDDQHVVRLHGDDPVSRTRGRIAALAVAGALLWAPAAAAVRGVSIDLGRVEGQRSGCSPVGLPAAHARRPQSRRRGAGRYRMVISTITAQNEELPADWFRFEPGHVHSSQPGSDPSRRGADRSAHGRRPGRLRGARRCTAGSPTAAEPRVGAEAANARPPSPSSPSSLLAA